MTKDNNGIRLIDNDKLNETYGRSIGDILSTTMLKKFWYYWEVK